MSKPATLSIKVTSKTFCLFTFLVHRREKVEDLAMSEEYFYRKYGTNITFPHYEIEVIKPDFRNTDASKTHYHKAENQPGHVYVCWTGQVSTKEQAGKVALAWAACAVYVLETGNDSSDLISKYCPGGFPVGLVEGAAKEGIVVEFV